MKCKFHAVAEVLFLAVILLSMGGCVTDRDIYQGRPYIENFKNDKEWEVYEELIANSLMEGIGSMMVKDVRGLIPKPPIGSKRTPLGKRYYWQYSAKGSLDVDLAVYGRSSGGEESHVLIIDFNSHGILSDFEIYNIQNPVRSSYISSRPIVEEGMVYLHYNLLSELLGKKIDGSLERNRAGLKEDFREVGGELIQKVKDVAGEVNGGSSSSAGPVSGSP